MVEKEQRKSKLDEYSIIRQLGTGAFGIVYLARDKNTQELVAIK